MPRAKIDPKQVEQLNNLVAPLDTEERRTWYREGKYPRAAATQDLNKRYRWDLLWAVNRTNTEGLNSVLPFDEQLSDAHIYTAPDV
jgi:hypothetical protein